jgi:hypothetical protein
MNVEAKWKLIGTNHVTHGGLQLPIDATRELPYYTEMILDADTCDQLYHEVIEKYGSRVLSHVYRMDGTGSNVDLNTRYTHYYNPYTLPSGRDIENIFNCAVSAAIKKLWDVEAKPIHEAQVLGYEERCMFVTHADNSVAGSGTWKRNDKERDVSAILYITEHAEHATRPGQFSGGELSLDNFTDSTGNRVLIRPRKGELVLFPSHPMFLHSVRPVSGGYRVALVNWWHVSSNDQR